MPKTCSRPGCAGRAVARLSYAYAESQVEVAGITSEVSPGEFLLCQTHLDRLTLPKGWTLVADDLPKTPTLASADIEALAERIRRVGGVGSAAEPEGTEFSLSNRANLVTLTTRAHLRVVADAKRYDQRAK